jgi:hypothetical protein
MVNALTQFVSSQMGEKYIEYVIFTLKDTLEESAPQMALFFILSPSDDPVKSLETMRGGIGFSEASDNFITFHLVKDRKIMHLILIV